MITIMLMKNIVYIYIVSCIEVGIASDIPNGLLACHNPASNEVLAKHNSLATCASGSMGGIVWYPPPWQIKLYFRKAAAGTEVQVWQAHISTTSQFVSRTPLHQLVHPDDVLLVLRDQADLQEH